MFKIIRNTEYWFITALNYFCYVLFNMEVETAYTILSLAILIKAAVEILPKAIQIVRK